MMKVKCILFCALFCSYSPLFSQKEMLNWVFGWHGGLSFQSGTATPFASGVYAREGISAISDRNTGALLFYTDGTSVWDKNHVFMQNGTGLYGDYTSCQSALIVPIPGSSTRYYIFTADYINGTDGYCYSIVDMAANGGLGAVEAATKNTLLFKNNTEKMTVARHCNGKDFWLILRASASKTFYVYAITSAGISTPKTFDLGKLLVPETWNESGYLKLSPDQRTLAHTVGPTVSDPASWLELLHFDPATGDLSGPFLTIENMQFAYGVEFSKSGKLLYVSNIFNVGYSHVFQYNLDLGNAADILASKTILVEDLQYNYGALQMGPDGMIYVAKEDGYDNGSYYMDRIRFPEKAGTACQYEFNDISLGAPVLVGLPNFPSYYNYEPPKIGYQKNCLSGAYRFNVGALPTGSSISWDFGDPASGTVNQSTGLSPGHLFSGPGDYLIQAIVLSPCGTDTLHTQVDIELLPDLDDVHFCEGESLLLQTGIDQTNWNQNTVGPEYSVSQSGWVHYSFPDAEGCIHKDSILATMNPNVQSFEKIEICQGDTAWINGIAVMSSGLIEQKYSSALHCDSTHITNVIVVNPGELVTESHFLCEGDSVMINNQSVNAPGTYTYAVLINNKCWQPHEATVIGVAPPKLQTMQHKAGCNGVQSGSIRIVDPAADWQWKLGSGAWTQALLLDKLASGSYVFSVKNEHECLDTFSVNVAESDPLQVGLLVDSSFAECGVSQLNAVFQSDFPAHLQWSPAGLSTCDTCLRLTTTPGGATRFSVTVTDENGCTGTASAGVSANQIYHIYAPNAISPNDDGQNDFFTLFGSFCVKNILRLEVYDRWGSLLFRRDNLPPGHEPSGWDGVARNRLSNPGVYVWVAQIELFSGQQLTLSGSVTVVL